MRNLSVRYGSIVAVRDVTFEIAPGLTVLVGQNGAGKTSTLDAIAGVVASRGSIELNGRDISGTPPEQRAVQGIALIPDGRRLFPGLTVEQNLVVGSTPIANRRQAREAVRRTLDRFPILAERRGQRAGTLSGGEGQQLVIARALVAGPSVLLVDEPFQGLSPDARAQIESTLRIVARDAAVLVALPEPLDDADQIRIEHGTTVEVPA